MISGRRTLLVQSQYQFARSVKAQTSIAMRKSLDNEIKSGTQQEGTELDKDQLSEKINLRRA